MIKLIVCSATYRQSSATRFELNEKDPKNFLLARQNRFRVIVSLAARYDMHLRTIFR